VVGVVGAVAPRSRKAAEQDDTPTLLSAPVRFKENRNQMDDKLIELMWGRDKVAKSMNAQVSHTAVGSKACLVRWRELRPYGPLDGLCAVRPGQDLHLQEGAEAATKVRTVSQHAASTGAVSVEGGGISPVMSSWLCRLLKDANESSDEVRKPIDTAGSSPHLPTHPVSVICRGGG
jgi:hypothetical protein